MEHGSRFDHCRWRGCEASCVDEVEMCWYHFRLVGQKFFDHHTIFGAKALEQSRERREVEIANRPDPEVARNAWWRERSVVYYVRVNDYVKIGYTIHLRERVNSLRINQDAVLAVEPGWRETEAQRHAQFADERQGRRENFNPSRRLMAHIDVVRSKHGEPWEFTERRVKAAGPQSAHMS